MKQVTKLYLSSFLKNQTYFTPIMILFLQFHHLSYSEIFWVFTIGSIVSFLAEIPTGVFADFYGKKKSITIAKIGIFSSFVIFGFSKTFWMFILAQIVYELGNSFRTGSETAYTYDYLKQNPENPSYTEVKGKQKYYARVGEGIASAVGGFIAASLGYNAVFFIAAIPAFVNVINVLNWERIKERESNKIGLRDSIKHTKNSVCEIACNKSALRITINIMIFTAVLVAMQKFIQPYMINANVPVEWFGIIYAISLILTALAVRYSYLVENRFGGRQTINWLTFLAFIPALILGFKFVSLIGVGLFFLIVIIANIRSPIANNEFHKKVGSENRSTTGSILELSKSFGKMIILPAVGYVAEIFSIYTAILILSIILLLSGLLFYIKKDNNKKQK
jgi:MFS family permease